MLLYLSVCQCSFCSETPPLQVGYRRGEFTHEECKMARVSTATRYALCPCHFPPRTPGSPKAQPVSSCPSCPAQSCRQRVYGQVYIHPWDLEVSQSQMAVLTSRHTMNLAPPLPLPWDAGVEGVGNL